MNKKSQQEHPFFDPDKPGSIFVGIDRYHHYTPQQPLNALTFVQEGNADDRFRQFLLDNIGEAECCPYIPDMELLRYDLHTMKRVPPFDPHVPFEEYISKVLLPFFQEHCLPPARRRTLSMVTGTKVNRIAAYSKDTSCRNPHTWIFVCSSRKSGHCTGANPGMSFP